MTKDSVQFLEEITYWGNRWVSCNISYWRSGSELVFHANTVLQPRGDAFMKAYVKTWRELLNATVN